jgi:hypothetical protein
VLVCDLLKHETSEGWRAHIQKAGVGRRLGLFGDEIVAAQA